MTEEEQRMYQYDLNTAWAKGWVAHEQDPNGVHMDLPAFFRATHPKCAHPDGTPWCEHFMRSRSEHYPTTDYRYCDGQEMEFADRQLDERKHYCALHTALRGEDKE